jgi:hypothetical protein
MPPPTGKDRERREDVVKLRLADDRRDAGELRARCDGIGEWARMVDLGRGGVQAGGLSEMARSPQRLLRVHSESPPCRRGRKPMHEHTEHLAHFLDCPHYTKAGSQLGAPRTNLSVAPRAWRDCPLAYLVGVVLCFSLHSISHLRPHLPLQPCFKIASVSYGDAHGRALRPRLHNRPRQSSKTGSSRCRRSYLASTPVSKNARPISPTYICTTSTTSSGRS